MRGRRKRSRRRAAGRGAPPVPCGTRRERAPNSHVRLVPLVQRPHLLQRLPHLLRLQQRHSQRERAGGGPARRSRCRRGSPGRAGGARRRRGAAPAPAPCRAPPPSRPPARGKRAAHQPMAAGPGRGAANGARGAGLRGRRGRSPRRGPPGVPLTASGARWEPRAAGAAPGTAAAHCL